MPLKRSHNLAVAERRQKVADLYLQGWTQMAIAAHIGNAQTTVSADLRKIHAEWMESAVRDFDEARGVELKKLDRIEREAWAAWERSQKPAQSAQFNDETNQRRTRRHVKNQYGDPRFLEIVHKCIVGRCALLGLNKTPMEIDSDGQSFVERRDRIVAVVTALRDRSGGAAVGEGLVLDQPRLLCADSERGTVDAGPPPGAP